MPWTKIYSDNKETEATLKADNLRALTFKEALREAQAHLLRTDPDVFLMGEGIDDVGGVFGTTKGLHEEFGRGRVMDAPIAENGLTGIAIGAAAAGMRPIFIHMRVDFLPMSMDQIVNHAAKWHYMTGGRVNIPLVIRSIIGRGWGSAAQHSQALHALFTHIPGLKVVMPSTPYDAKGLLISAAYDGNPIIFMEHRWTFDTLGYVPEEAYTVPIGKGIIRREGKDATIIAISQMGYEAMKAAKTLSGEGIEVEIIDPRTLNPLDTELLITSVRKTGHLVIADVACRTGGVGAEIITRIAEQAHGALKAAPERVSFPDCPTPACPVLEEAYYPGANQIAEAVRRTLKKSS